MNGVTYKRVSGNYKKNIMNKIILIFLIVLTQSAMGQVILEHKYPNGASPKSLMLIQLDSATYKYVVFDETNSQFTLYNLNHSVYLNVNIPLTYNYNTNYYQVSYITKSLFDCDTSNIEYVLNLLGDAQPNTYPKKILIYRTNGTLLYSVDSCCYMNYSYGWKHGPVENQPIVKTPTGTKLILRCLDGSGRIFSVCGNLPNQIKDINDVYFIGNPYPNPTDDLITIPYSLPQGETNGTIKIFDSNGNEIKSFIVDSNFTSLKLSTSELPNGIYFYQLYTAKGHADIKKIIKVE
jgi:hypothetical protein